MLKQNCMQLYPHPDQRNLELTNMFNIKSIESEAKLYSRLIKFSRDCINSGVSDDKYDFQNARTLILNSICIIYIVFLFGAYLIVGINEGFLKTSWVLLLTPHLFYIVHLNSRKKFEIAKVLFIAINILSIGAVALLIRGAGVEYNLMITICLAPFLFGKTRILLAYVFASCLVFCGVRYIAALYPVNHFYEADLALTSSLSLGFAVISTLLLIIAFQRFNMKFSHSLILKKKYFEAELSDSKQDYRSLFENMIGGFTYCRMVFKNGKAADFIYLDANAAFEKQTGLDDVIGKKISELIPGIQESNSDLLKIFGRVALSGIPERFETYISGIDKWFDVSVYSPEKRYFIAVFDLISERKLAEEKQKLFSSIVNYSEDAIISKLLDGTVTSWNPGAEKSFGYAAEEIIGKNISTLTPFHLRNEENEIMQKGEVIERYETVRIRKDGTLINVSLTISPILDATGETVGFSQISCDISKRIKAEASLRERLAFNEGILGSLSAEIAVMNDDGAIIEVNKAWNDFAEANGESRLDRVSIGRNYLEICETAVIAGDAIAKEVLDGILSVINNRQLSFNMEYPCDSPSEKRWFAMQVTSFVSDERKIVVAHEDISKRKQAEYALVELNEHLEQKVEERTNSLTSSKMELERKNQDITDSITYALHLQRAMLPDSRLLFANFSEAFIINLPQSIVSGDFYWFNKSQNKFTIACADSTGHGVPGAFMSIVGAQLIDQAVKQDWNAPSEILERIDEGLNKALGGNEGENMADGMDMAFCIIDPAKKQIEFAGAMSSIVLVSSGKAQVYRGSRFALGKYMLTKDKHFETQTINYSSGDMLYLYTDGLKDQFGGEKNKKFMFERQVQLLEKTHNLAALEQERIIMKTFEAWKGDVDQVDDVMVMGVRL